MNSNSQEIIELGTKQYPYKTIGLAFVEIQNFHSNSERSIYVYLMNGNHTYDYLLKNANFIINITQVTVMRYGFYLNNSL